MKNLWLLAGTWLVLSVGCGFVPLLREVGYERALAASIWVGLTGPVLGALEAKRAELRKTSWWRFVGRTLLAQWAMIALTVAAGWLTEQLTMPCGAESALLFYPLLPGVGAVHAVGLGAAGWVLLRRRWWLLPLGVAALDLGGLVLHIYDEPQIFAFSVMFGWWPGSLYDEAIAPSSALWAHRGLTLMLGVFWLLLGRAARARSVAGGARAFALGLLLLLGFRSGPELGFWNTRARLASVLSVRVETPHFIIHLPAGTDAAWSRAVAADHEFHYARLVEWFKGAPGGPITSWVFANEDQKAELIGARGTMIARPWSHELFIHGLSKEHRVLGHELAHVFAAQWNDGLLAVPARAGLLVRAGLIEGLAEATEEPRGALSHHQGAAVMKELGILPPIRDLMAPAGFWAQASSRSYIAAGSFIRWVRAEHGLEWLRAAYASGREPVPDGWVESWERFLDDVELDRIARQAGAAWFSRPSIFSRACPHVVANLRLSAKRAIARGDLEQADRDLEEAFALNPDPAHHLHLARALMERGEAPMRPLTKVLTSTIPGPQRARALALRSRVRVSEGDILRAHRDAERAAALETSFAAVRLQTARALALAETSTSVAILDYLDERLSSDASMFMLTDASRSGDDLVRYLLARRLSNAGLLKAAERTLEGTVMLPDVLSWELELMRGRLAEKQGDYERAIGHFDKLAGKAVPFEVKAEAQRAADRARFMRGWSEDSVDVMNEP